MKATTESKDGQGQKKSGSIGKGVQVASESGSHTPKLIFRLDGKLTSVSSQNLADDDFCDNLIAECSKLKSRIDVSLKDILEFPPRERVECFDLILAIKPGNNLKFHTRVGQPKDNLFQGMLSLLVDDSDLDRYERAKSAALETAVLLYPNALEVASRKILERLRELGVKGVTMRGLERDARKIERALQSSQGGPAEEGTAQPVLNLIEDAPVGEAIVVPAGWSMTEDGITKGADDGRVIIPAKLLITERHVDINGDTELVTVAWHRDGKWKSRVVDRAAIASGRAIVDALAPYGVPVTSNNAVEVVQYLSDFETVNLVNLPVIRVSRQLGWQGEQGGEGFLCGRKLITGANGTGSKKDTKQAIRFCGADEGDDQIAAGFRENGKFTEWKKAIETIKPFPRVRLALYATFVSVLLSIFRARNFVIDFSGKTTAGKTTCLRLAASAWGDPDDNNPAGLVKTWDATATFRERVPAVLNHLPYFLDDNKHARHPEEVAKTIYSVTQGRGRGRGSTKGIARQDTWHTALYTSGEQPATSFTQDGGTRARVLSLWGSPFKKVDAETRKLVRKLNDQLKRHYGHAGPRFVQYVLDHRDKWGDWKTEYLAKVSEYESLAADNQFAGRMATDFAAIAVTARIAHEALDLPWQYTDPITPLWKVLAKEANEADRAAAALRYVMDWAYAHQAEFFGKSNDLRGRQPSAAGWAGRWGKNIPLPEQKGDQENWPWIGFLPARLRSILQDGGFEPESIVRTWRDENWLATTTEKKGTRFEVKARVGDATPWLIAIRREAIENVYK